MLLDIDIITLTKFEGALQIGSSMHTRIPKGVSVLCYAEIIIYKHTGLFQVLGSLKELCGSHIWLVKHQWLLQSVNGGRRDNRVASIQQLHRAVLSGLLSGCSIP
jgi:hypothetical protein